MNKTLTVFIVNSSWNMRRFKSSHIKGINSYISSQAKTAGDELFTLITTKAIGLNRDELELSTLCNMSAFKDAPTIDSSIEGFYPNGQSALRDGIGYTIDNVGRHLCSLPENERPSKVIVIIQTNDLKYEDDLGSSVFNEKKLEEKILHQRNKYSWEFVLSTTNEDSTKQANLIGINKVIKYSETNKYIKNNYSYLSRYTTVLRE